MCPYLSTKKRSDITALMKRNGRKKRIDSYARVTTLKGAKRAIVSDGPLLVVFNIFDTGTQMWIRKNPEDTRIAAHAMAIVGYNDDQKHFIVRNSWGSKWGDNGHCYYRYSDWGRHVSVWTCIDSVV